MDAATRAAGRLAALLASTQQQDQRVAPSPRGLAPWQKRKILSYIEDQLGQPLRVSDLAKLVSLSTTHFFRAFKESFGEPPHAYITRMKIARVRTLMLTTSESLAQIALAGGFSDQAHLCKCFRQMTGSTLRVASQPRDRGLSRHCRATYLSAENVVGVSHSLLMSWTS